MKNELDIVNNLIKNEKPAKAQKDEAVKIPHVKHMVPEVKGTDASKEKKSQPHWPGDCIPLTKEQIAKASLPEKSYLYVKTIPGPNSIASVYDPVHWIYGWGETTPEAINDCIENIHNWRLENPELIADALKVWEERVANYGHPLKFKQTDIPAPSAYKAKHIESKTTTDILKEIGL
jgi:hypothetical protein